MHIGEGEEPVKVIESTPDLHYFYWYWDVYKRDDYEPVKVYTQPEGTVLASRFHWFILTVWPEPTSTSGKPTVDFYELVKVLGQSLLASHTPLAYSKSSRIHFGELAELNSIESFLFYRLYLPFLRKEARKRAGKTPSKKRGYLAKLSAGAPTGDYLFDPARSKAYFFVSDKPPNPKTLPEEISNLLWPPRPGRPRE